VQKRSRPGDMMGNNRDPYDTSNWKWVEYADDMGLGDGIYTKDSSTRPAEPTIYPLSSMALGLVVWDGM
jgi:hypothetical protein